MKNNEKKRDCIIAEEHEEKKLSLICSSCYEVLGNFNYSGGYHVSIEAEYGSNLNPDILARMFSPRFQVEDNIPYKCPNCEKVTRGLIIDSNFANIIASLNRAGIKTDYCCEGHAHENRNLCEFAYLSFDAHYRSYFDMSHPLLRWWYMDEHVTIVHGLTRIILRIKEDCPLYYYMRKIHCKELKDYVQEVLIPELNADNLSETSNEINDIDIKDMG